MTSLDNRGFSNIQKRTTSNDYENIILVFNKAMSKLRILSCVMIAVGSVLMFVGIVIVANIGSHAMFPFTSGSQIWSGFVILRYLLLTVLTVHCGTWNFNVKHRPTENCDITAVLMQGILGFRATTFKVVRISDIVLGPLKCYFGAFYGFLITSFSTNGINLGYSISGFMICSDKTCADNDTLMMTMSIIGAVLAFCAFICTFLGLFLICKYRRRFGFAPERRNIVAFHQPDGYGSPTNTSSFSMAQSYPPPPYSEKN